MSENKSFVYQSIASSVWEHGIDTVFGLLGDANLFVVNHYVQSCRGVFIPAVHEGGAVLMALAYSQISDKVGVAIITHGPALTNCLTALTEGVRGNIPMVLMVGDTPTTNSQNLQNIDQREFIKATGAGFEQFRSPETASIDIANAFYRARLEMRPIVLNIPADFMWQEVNHKKITFQKFEERFGVLEGKYFDKVADAIASAKRPIVLAGRGAIDARDQLILFADRLEAPLATTLKAKDLFRGHSKNMGIMGGLSTQAARDIVVMSDCVISFGASLHHFTTNKGKLIKDKYVVQINQSMTENCKNFRPNMALTADACLAVNMITKRLDEINAPASGFTREFESSSLTTHPSSDPSKSKDGYIDYIYTLDRLEQSLPKNLILSTDGGRFMTEVWSRISVPDPKSFLLTANFGSIGLGLQEAIGASCAAPDRPVVLFTGDGGFMMGGINEFNTAVRLKQDLIVIVCNDSAYGAEYIQLEDRNMNPSITQFDWPSFTEIAAALGGQGVFVQSTEDLKKAIEAIEMRDRPLLIELRLDPSCVPRMRC